MGRSNGGKHNEGNGAAYVFLRGLVGHHGDECVIWPFSRGWHGYGRLGYMAKQKYAHRFLCEMVYGPAPTPKHQAAHSCGQGHEGCVNPNHLSWKTVSENSLDRRMHGTDKRQKSWNLADEQVAEIRSLAGKETQISLATRFGVTHGTISRIINGHLHTETDRARNDTPLTWGQYQKIMDLKDKETQRTIAEMFNVTQSYISRLHSGWVPVNLRSDE